MRCIKLQILFILFALNSYSQASDSYCFEIVKEELLGMTNISEPKNEEVYFMNIKSDIKYKDKSLNNSGEYKIWFSKTRIIFQNDKMELYQDENNIVSINHYNETITISALVNEEEYQNLKFGALKNMQTESFDYMEKCNCLSVPYGESAALKLDCMLNKEGQKKYNAVRLEFLYDEIEDKVLKTMVYFSPEHKKISMRTDFVDINLNSTKKIRTAMSYVYYNDALLTKYKKYTINNYTKY